MYVCVTSGSDGQTYSIRKRGADERYYADLEFVSEDDVRMVHRLAGISVIVTGDNRYYKSRFKRYRF